MQWSEVRKAYPNEWLIIEALQAQTTPSNRRQLVKIAVVEHYTDGSSAMQSYCRLHQQYPAREFYFVHTSRNELDIREQQWLGIRRGHAAIVAGYENQVWVFVKKPCLSVKSVPKRTRFELFSNDYT